MVTATKYQHTDALGSPVAVTNAAGTVIERNDYEPYGAVIGKPAYSGIGYTGHVMDGGTGLTYMQQRYYDQSIGRFLSVDPVTALSNPVSMFNRYKYSTNNPYRFTDPDGRCDAPLGTRICTSVRKFSASDILIVQSYDTRTQTAVALPSGSSKGAELRPLQQKAASSLNRAGKELQSRGLKEHIEILNKLNVYMSVDTVGEGKAFVSQSPVFDLIINSNPFARLWDGFKVGLMLHEVHHFTINNQSIYNYQKENKLPMGTGTGYENDAFQFQRNLGFPSSGRFDFNGLEEDAK